VWWTIARWLQKKHGLSLQRLASRYGLKRPGRRSLRWYEGDIAVFATSSVRVEQYKMGWMRDPYFAANVDGEPGA
jgi:transcriptional regulator with XRE-family HTH domain